MIHTSKSGVALAAAAFAIAVAATFAVPANAAMTKKVHCFGINSCKGQSACKSGNHGCKGLNSCKGQGFLDVSAKTCAAKHGKVIG
jgi:uncharacterized membrane protein